MAKYRPISLLLLGNFAIASSPWLLLQFEANFGLSMLAAVVCMGLLCVQIFASLHVCEKANPWGLIVSHGNSACTWLYMALLTVSLTITIPSDRNVAGWQDFANLRMQYWLWTGILAALVVGLSIWTRMLVVSGERLAEKFS